MLQGSGLENLKTILQVQIVQKNAITSAVLQANSCVPIEEPDIHKGLVISITETDIHHISTVLHKWSASHVNVALNQVNPTALLRKDEKKI